MKRKELNELKEWISSLTDEEISERDLYLMKLSNGEFQGPPVGYSSIDKSWLGKYDEDKYTTDFPKELFYDGLVRQNKKNMKKTAIDYFHTKISYKKYFERVNSLIKALSRAGVKDGDYVGVCLASIPESMYSLGALSYLGAAGIFFPPYLDKKSMQADINKNKTKILIVMDVIYDKFKDSFDELLDNSSVEQVVIVPTLNSSILRKVQKKKELKDPRFIYYNDFIDKAKDDKMPPKAKYSPNKPLAVVYSSGTTGILKGVLLSNDSFVNSAASYVAFGFDLTPGQKVYQVIPVWTSTGLIADGSTALYYGCELYQNPTFDPIVYSKNIGIHRINWAIATTELVNGIKEIYKKALYKFLIKLGILNYKKLTNVYIGGTISTKNDRDELNELFKELGVPAKIRSSFGTCENGSIVTAELNQFDYPDNSVGTPIPGTIVMCVDKEGNEVPTGERGEIAVYTTCGMIDYYNRPDLKSVFFKDGRYLFKHTGDIGRMTKDGVLLYEGRGNDTSIVDGEEIYNFDVKNTMLEFDSIYDCEVFTNDDGIFCSHIIFKEDVINIDKEISYIQEYLYERLNNKIYVPQYFKIRHSFPMAGSTKRDYKKLKSETDDLKYYKFDKSKRMIKK